MTQFFKERIKSLMTHLPMKDMIIFESYPTFCDNTRVIYDELRARDLNNQYRYIWIDINRNSFIPELNDPNTRIISLDLSSITGKILFRYYCSVAKMIITGNHIFKKIKDEQYYYYASHGTALKDCSSYYHLPSDVDACLSISPYFAEYDARNLGVSPEKMTSYGFPRTDCFFDDEHLDMRELFSDRSFDHTILWMPTFRKHRNGEIYASDVSLPVIHDEEIAKRVNEFAKKNGILIILLPHFSQIYDLSYLNGLSNIVPINNDMLLKKDIFLYRLIKETDALLTDYSSIIVDYLLLNRPIGLCQEDHDKYKKNIGFVGYAEELFSCGEKINSEEDLYRFMNNVVLGNDLRFFERQKMMNRVFETRDGNATKRVCDHICRILNEKEC